MERLLQIYKMSTPKKASGEKHIGLIYFVIFNGQTYDFKSNVTVPGKICP
jgi:hypothetical protein